MVRSMGAGRVVICGVVAGFFVAGCGGGGHKASTTTSTPSSSTAAATSPPPTGIRSQVLAPNELAGFKVARIATYKTPSAWLSSEQGVPANQLAAEKAMLARDGFRIGVHEDLMNGSTPGLSIVQQFRSPDAARNAFALYVSQFKASGSSAGAYAPFNVPGIPGATGFSLGGSNGGGINIAFTDGADYYLVGQEGASSKTIAGLIAAAQRLYHRVHQSSS
jgi:hypothetical protein